MDLATSLLWQQDVFPPGLERFPVSVGMDVAVADLGQERLATTLSFNQVDTGLESEGQDVRSELFTVGRVAPEVAVAALQQVAQKLQEFNADVLGLVPAQPGTLVPGLTLEGCTVRHGVFVVPYVWGEDVPRFQEPGQLTVMLQLVLLTDDEYDYAVTYGVPELQKAMGQQGIDLLDWSR